MVSNKFINSNNSGLYKQLSDRSPEEIKIKLKHGEWEVEITCLESRVKQVVADVLSSLDTAKLNGPVVQAQFNELRHEIESLKSRPSADFGSANKPQKISTKGGMTCRGLLENLWMEGYFETERSLGEVHEDLSRRGYNYDRTAVSHSLTDMVRENIMTRTGSMRNYRYIQKRPRDSTA